MTTRRHFILSIAAAMLSIASGLAQAAQPSVEIVAMAHPPVQDALKPLREWLAKQGVKLHVAEIDAESQQGVRRLASIGLAGHVPIAILIDGRQQYRRKDGSMVTFVNFPAVKESPPGARGDWQIADVQNVLAERMNKP